MVGVVVRLKLRILRNSLRGRHLAGMLAGGAVGLLAAAVTLLLGVVPFEHSRTSVDVLAAVYACWLVGWVLAPLVTGGGDETLRPEHFSLLPIRPTKLAAYLLAASFIAITAVVTLIAFASLVVYGARLGAGPALLGVVFAVLQLALAVLLYRVVLAAVGSLLSSRKGKELGIVLVALLGFAGVGVNYLVNSLGPALISGSVPEFATVMRALPSGWGPVAVHAAGAGDWTTAALLLAATAALVVLLTLAWGALLRRRTTVSAFRGSARAPKSDTGSRRSVLPTHPVGAVAAKELRTWWRDARRRMALLSSLIIGLVFILVPTFSDDGGEAKSGVTAFVSVLVVGFACLQAGNLYGFDGSALWHTIVTPRAYRADVRGRQLGWALIVGPIGLLLAAVLPAATGDVYAYPWVLGMVPALLGAGAGLLVLQSVYLPYALPDPRHNSNPFSAGGRPGCARALLILAMGLLLLLGAVPPAALALAGVLTDAPILGWLAVPVGVATGTVLAWWWGRLAITRLSESAPELLATVSKEP